MKGEISKLCQLALSKASKWEIMGKWKDLRTGPAKEWPIFRTVAAKTRIAPNGNFTVFDAPADSNGFNTVISANIRRENGIKRKTTLETKLTLAELVD